jgi:hypothetical protein
VRDSLLFVSSIGVWPLLTTIRPQAFSVCFFAVLLFVLDRARQQRTRSLFVLPVLFAIWVNVHGGWVVGAGTLAIFVVCSWFDSRWSARNRMLLLASASLSALATLCNPYGVSLLGFLTETVRPARADIIEWQPATRVPIVGLVLWMVPTAAAVFGIWRQQQATVQNAETAEIAEISRPGFAQRALRTLRLFPAVRFNHTVYSMLVVLLLAVGSFRVIRLVGFYALAVAFLIVPWIASRDTFDEAPPSRSAAGWLRTVSTCGALIVIAVAAFGRTLPMDGEWLPERESVVFINTHDVRGRMLTWFDYGEFAIWHFTPAVRVSMDGRRETVYSDDVRDRHRRIYANAPDAVDEVTRLDPDYVWLPAKFDVVNRLEASGWCTIFSGPRSVLLAKQPACATTTQSRSAPAESRIFPGP